MSASTAIKAPKFVMEATWKYRGHDIGHVCVAKGMRLENGNISGEIQQSMVIRNNRSRLNQYLTLTISVSCDGEANHVTVNY